MFKLSTDGKKRLAKIVSWPPVHFAMQIGVTLFAPRHRIGVGAVCLNEQKEILLLNHVFHPSHPWNIPGGWLDQHEEPESCIKREILEETGLTADVQKLIYFHHKPNPSHFVIIYQAIITGGQLNINNNEILEARWFTPDALPPNLLKDTRIAIQKALNPHR